MCVDTNHFVLVECIGLAKEPIFWGYRAIRASSNAVSAIVAFGSTNLSFAKDDVGDVG